MAKKRKSRGPWTAAQKAAARQRHAAKKERQLNEQFLSGQSMAPEAGSDVEFEDRELKILGKLSDLFNDLYTNERKRALEYLRSRYLPIPD